MLCVTSTHALRFRNPRLSRAERAVAAQSRGREARHVRVLQAESNAAHLAVTDLERTGLPVRVITQNVDGLHQLAGMPARKSIEPHGTARSFVCTKCHKRGPMEDAIARVEAGEDDPLCLECGGILKSATVMFGERLDPMVLSEACQVFIAVGSSLQVQPAAGSRASPSTTEPG
ncbi:Sir2 family NAD-dependent protein deacetylase [Streptomyces mirabilis]|uniref:Sir2 family NAD-dependent protein deacetylase n=1 Tax=Streptomyces mirabilis TaxID=68239 RepID=UPI003696A026